MFLLLWVATQLLVVWQLHKIYNRENFHIAKKDWWLIVAYCTSSLANCLNVAMILQFIVIYTKDMQIFEKRR